MKKKVLIIAFLIMLIITIFQINNMYALYTSQLEGEYAQLLGNWTIKVNNTDISSGGKSVNFELTEENFKFVESNSVIDNKIAPGRSMYFDIYIDPIGTDVSVRYDVKFNFAKSPNANLVVTGVESYLIKDESTTKIENPVKYTEKKTYTGVIPIDKIEEKYKNKIRFYVTWVNNKLYDSKDSILGTTEGSKVNVLVDFDIMQYMGESY